MARRTLPEKHARVLRFLNGIARNYAARSALMAHGFDEVAFDEGWRLLRAASHTTFVALPAPTHPTPHATLAALARWQKRWFVIAGAALDRHHPKIGAALLGRARTQVVVDVAAFINHVEVLGKSASTRPARALLARRGLTAAVVAEGRGLVAMLKEWPTDEPFYDPTEDDAIRARGEAAVWAWFVEWGRIARQAITSRRDLIQLGFLAGGDLDDGSPGLDDMSPTAAKTSPMKAVRVPRVKKTRPRAKKKRPRR